MTARGLPRGLRAIEAALACLAGAGVVACGSGASTFSANGLQGTIAHAILVQTGIHARVSCPPSVPRRVGARFTCVAHLQAGSYPLTATVTSTSGEVRYGNRAPLVILDIAKVQRAIARSIAAQRHLRATVRCPTEVLQQAGVTFTCEATAAGRTYPFEVVQTDSHGHVRYVGR